MPDPNNHNRPDDDQAEYGSDCDLIEICEEDTVPGEPSETWRKWMEAKYGKKASPSKPPEAS